MAEEIKQEVELEEKTVEVSPVEELKSHVEDTVAAKTADFVSVDKAAEMVAEVKTAADEAVAELKGALDSTVEELHQLKAEGLSAPAVTGATMETKFDDISYEGATLKGQVYTKAEFDNTDVPGGRVNTNAPFYTLQQANPFRGRGALIPAGGAGVIKLPSINSISWASEAAQPSAARTAGGSSDSKNVTIETWVSENAWSVANLQDVPSMDAEIAGLMAAQLGLAEASDAVAVMKAASGLGNAVTTGVAAGLPTPANVVGKLIDMKTGLGASYQNGAYFLSRALYGVLAQSNNNGLNYDVASGVERLFGSELVIVDALEATAAGNLVGVFMDAGRGLALCSSSEMTIGRYDQTRPGAMTYFGHARFKNAVWDNASVATLKVGA